MTETEAGHEALWKNKNLLFARTKREGPRNTDLIRRSHFQ